MMLQIFSDYSKIVLVFSVIDVSHAKGLLFDASKASCTCATVVMRERDILFSLLSIAVVVPLLILYVFISRITCQVFESSCE